MRPTLFFPVILLILWLIPGSPNGTIASSPDSWEGGWNLTESDGGRSYPSWLGLKRQGGGWEGSYLHRGGHPMPARVQISGSDITVQMVPEPGSPPRPDVQWPVLKGKLEGGKLAGTGTDRRGGAFTWAAERTPDRHQGSDRDVIWGTPIQLFNGRDLTGWQAIGERESRWKAADGILVNEDTGANFRTVDEFRDFKLHIEFKIPPKSNSGVYLRGRYESQVADDYGKEPYSRMVGGIYGRLAPKVNATKPAGEWNVLEATLVGYRVTIVLNGQTTLDGQLIEGITGGALNGNEREPGPIMLQGDHGPVYYRNITLTPAR